MSDDLKFEVSKTEDFENWFQDQNSVTQDLISARILKIMVYGYFGTTNYFDEIIELKWKSGLRVYSARLEKKLVVLLAGGNKNGQNKDIRKAKSLLKKIKNSEAN